jgi:hypothetical protein
VINPNPLTAIIGGTLINNEKKQQGLIGWNVYWYYFKKGKAGIFILMTIFLLISVFSRIVGSWWLTQWTINKYGFTPELCKSFSPLELIL